MCDELGYNNIKYIFSVSYSIQYMSNDITLRLKFIIKLNINDDKIYFIENSLIFHETSHYILQFYSMRTIRRNLHIF